MSAKRPPSTLALFAYQYLTLGIYFLVWSHRLGSELRTALKRQAAVPSLWWLIVPGGSYYWVWRMSESLAIATGRRIKQADTFLWYIVFTILPTTFLNAVPNVDKKVIENHSHEVFVAIGILVVILILLGITGHAIYMSYLQKRLNQVRGTG